MRRKWLFVSVIVFTVPLLLLVSWLLSLKQVERTEEGYIIGGDEYIFTSDFSAVKKERVLGVNSDGLFCSLKNDPTHMFIYLQPWPFHRPWNLLVKKEAHIIKPDLKLVALEFMGSRCEDYQVISEVSDMLESSPSILEQMLPARVFELRLYYDGIPQVFKSMIVIEQQNDYYLETNDGSYLLCGKVSEWIKACMKT